VRLQQHLLDRARDASEDLGVPVRTRAIVGRSAAKVLLDVAREEEEEADQLLLGLTGTRRRRDVVFGTTVDPILERAPCEVTLVRKPHEPTEVVALAGRGAHAPVAARQGAELARAFGADLRLLNVQGGEPGEDEEGQPLDPLDIGRDTVVGVAEEAGLADDQYDVDVRVAADVRDELLAAVEDVDTLAVGATGRSLVAQALYGSVPQAVASKTAGTVLMARGAQRTPRTLREAVVQRLGGRLS